jgi:hypothetical protein
MTKESNWIPMTVWEEGHSSYDLKDNPHNGTMGFWKVDGVRHSAIVHTDHAEKAVKMSLEVVGDWEFPTVVFIGTEMPDVLPV